MCYLSELNDVLKLLLWSSRCSYQNTYNAVIYNESVYWCSVNDCISFQSNRVMLVRDFLKGITASYCLCVMRVRILFYNYSFYSTYLFTRLLYTKIKVIWMCFIRFSFSWQAMWVS